MKLKRKILQMAGIALLSATTVVTLSSCSIEKLFVLGGGNEAIPTEIETFDGTENAIFFALYNYYGYEGQHFTNKWLGMNDALANHGITVTNYEGNKDAKTFKIKREENCDLPEDAVIYMVNNPLFNENLVKIKKPIYEEINRKNDIHNYKY